MLRLLRILACAVATCASLLSAAGDPNLVDISITHIEGVLVLNRPTDLYVVPDAQGRISVSWEETTAGLGLQEIEVYVNGNLSTCVGCGPFAEPLKEGAVLVPVTGLSDCVHHVQLKAFVNRGQPNEDTDTSATHSVWLTPYAECTGDEECNLGEVGGPIDVATGRMYYEARDLVIDGPLPITLTRRYNSQSTHDGALGFGWHHSYMMRLDNDSEPGRKIFTDRIGRTVYFGRTYDGEPLELVWFPNRIEELTLEEDGSPVVSTVTDADKTQYLFNSLGKLTRIQDRNGNQINFGYSGANLTTITDEFGRFVTLSYDTNGRLENVVAGNRTVNYTYTGGQLTRVDYTQGAFSSFETYEYNDANDAHNLTDIKDGLGKLVEHHVYDSSDRVVETWSGNLKERLTLDYDPPATDQITRVTDSRGNATDYEHDLHHGVITWSSGPGCHSCGGGMTGKRIRYDRLINVREVEDATGAVVEETQYNYHPVYSLPGQRTEGYAPWRLTTSYTYDPTFNFVATESIPSIGSGACPHQYKVATNVYTTSGDLDTVTITGCNGENSFGHVTDYDYNGRGQILSVDGPRTDVSDVTAYAYYPDTAADNLKGRLHRVSIPKTPCSLIHNDLHDIATIAFPS